ncbi:BLUF domain-containing protein [Sphingomonas sp. Leaf62]|uniref:BLUF domain-containing protein n=1 Tax=Sphingomonas sp. Leaf62 TaxID=1736228 RepID=UPI0006F27910|nr:BLUF domain-containing protein [Sphingomonas sp. Leaf62]KQN72017.1 activator of photopigment and puc with BLUF domain protein [Sphingomonas sp. Leaf62]
MLQLIYVSTARNGLTVDLDDILARSRRNNRRDGITGLLHAKGRRFLQALEGDPAKVEAAYARIATDPRHFALVVLSRRSVEAREFGDWAMAADDGDGGAVAQVAQLVEHAAPSVRGTFEGFAGMRAA